MAAEDATIAVGLGEIRFRLDLGGSGCEFEECWSRTCSDGVSTRRKYSRVEVVETSLDEFSTIFLNRNVELITKTKINLKYWIDPNFVRNLAGSL